MSKRAYISRYQLLLKKLKQKPYSTYEELQSYIDNQLEYLYTRDEDLNMGFSKRTLQRDIKEIRELFDTHIEYSKSEKGYYISESGAGNAHFERMMEAFDLFNSLNIAGDLSPFIHLEKRRPQGTENLYGLLHAIKNRFQIKFSYQKFWDTAPNERMAEPYALKEFKNRWYILAKDLKDNNIKSFALDRLTQLEITRRHFQYPEHYNIEQHFRYCFGIISPKDEAPQDIILSFDPFQVKYIKTLPLHPSQEILVDNEEEVQISLKLFITQDLIMELLSFGEDMKVLQPQSLAAELQDIHKKAYKQYGSGLLGNKP